MKTSPSLPKKHSDARRHRHSFLIACSVYAPLTALAFFGLTVNAPLPAGEPLPMTIAFAQIAGAAAPAGAPALEAAPPREMDVEEKDVKEAAPEPQPEVPPPEPEPEVVPEPAPTPEPKPEPKPQTKPQPKPKPVEKKVEKPVEKKAPAPKEEKEAKPVPVPETPANATSQDPSPGVVSQTGGAPASGEAGIATLVHGETNDPFLADVKRLIESNLVYPRKARRFGKEGTALVQFTVAKDGRLSELVIHTSSGEGMLDHAALAAVTKAESLWGAPGRTVRLRLPVAFRLKNSR